MSGAIPAKNPYISAQEDSPRALAIAISNSPHFHFSASTPISRESAAFPQRTPPAHPPNIQPTRVTLLHPFQRKHSRASSPYPFERGIVKASTLLQRKGFSPVFQSYSYAPHIPTSTGLVRGELFGLVPFDPERVKTATAHTLLQREILPLAPLEKGEYEALKVFDQTAKERCIPFHDRVAIKQLIVELLDALQIDDKRRVRLINRMSRYAELQSIFKEAATINMDLGEPERLILRAIQTVAAVTDLHRIHPVELYSWVIGRIHSLNIPEKHHQSAYLCVKRYVHNKTHKSETASSAASPAQPISREARLMEDLARERDHPVLTQGSRRDIERWIDRKMELYGLPPDRGDEISARVHQYIIEYRVSRAGYMRGSSSAAASMAFPF
ncbi:MAG: hypothetical protein NTX49_09025 [Chlamydiae bacterium]|nr:hypothetical protein [Chlamydiota bacterium]